MVKLTASINPDRIGKPISLGEVRESIKAARAKEAEGLAAARERLVEVERERAELRELLGLTRPGPRRPKAAKSLTTDEKVEAAHAREVGRVTP